MPIISIYIYTIPIKNPNPKYPLVTKHGLLDNPLFSSMVLPAINLRLVRRCLARGCVAITCNNYYLPQTMVKLSLPTNYINKNKAIVPPWNIPFPILFLQGEAHQF